MSIIENKFRAEIAPEVTQSFMNYANESAYTEMLMTFLLMGSKYIGENKESARNDLISIHGQENSQYSKRIVEYIKSEKADDIFDIYTYERHLAQMMFTRSIDNLTTYFKDILSEVVNKKPEILKSKDTEKLDFILSFDSRDDLLKALTEKKVEELFFKGIVDIEKFFKERLGINLFKTDFIWKMVNGSIKQRNLIVHNRGKVSKEFVREFPEYAEKQGQYMVFRYDEISNLNLFLHSYFVDVDVEIADKFGIEKVKRII